MHRLLQVFTLLVLLSLGLSASAQVTAPAQLTSSAVGVEGVLMPRVEVTKGQLGKSHAAPQALVASALNYFDATTPVHNWIVPANLGGVLMISANERFTLPAPSGFLDSVAVNFSLISGDSVIVVISADTLYPTSAGLFHLPNLFDPNVQPYATAVILPDQLPPPAPGALYHVTVPFAHVQVPKEFHVMILPHYGASGNTSGFLVQGDSEAVRTLDPETSRSSIVLVNSSGQESVFLLDGAITFNGDAAPLYSNFDMTAYVQTQGSGVAGQISNAALSVYPNPAAVSTHIGGVSSASTVQVVDALGRLVLEQRVSAGGGELSTVAIPNGSYQLRVASDAGVAVSRLTVAH